ncbi:MAG: hypothetical protein PWQ25_891 [Deferribacteres bacterium]|nr:hypothetical protein [Deferribacteres bacterium]
MENSLYCIFYKTIDFSGGNFSIVTTKEISNTEGALFQKLKSESEKLIILNFKALVDKDTDSITRQVCVFEKDFSGIEFLVNIHVINRTPEKLYLCEVYIENTIYLKEVFEHLIHSRIISFVIYNFDNILFADKGFTCLTEYSEDELKNMDFSSFFNESFKEVIKNISDKRSKGFNINQEFHHLPIYTKSGYFKYVNAYDTTISYLGQNVGCMFIVDVSEEVSSKDLYSILYNLNSLIRKRIVSLEEFFNFLCSEIVKDKNISFAWVGKIYKRKRPKIIAKAGYEEGYLDYFMSVLSSDKYDIGPTFSSVKENKIVINQDTKSNPNILPWQEEMLKRNYHSSCAIPIKYKNEYFVLNLYSNKQYFFNETLMDTLIALQESIAGQVNNLNEIGFKNILLSTVENTYDWVMITDKNGIIEYVNDAVVTISGFSRKEIIGKTPRIFKSGLYDKSFYENLWKKITNGEIYKGAVTNKRKDGSYFQVDNTIVPVAQNGKIIKFVSIAKDITKEAYLEEEVFKFKYTDLLTGVLNREGFIENVNKQLEDFYKSKETAIVVVFDIYGFAMLNERYGFEKCNEILKKVSKELVGNFYRKDLVARVGSDSFGIFLRLDSDENLLKVIDKFLNFFKRPVFVDKDKLLIDINIGVSVWDGGIGATDLLARAEAALNLSKTEGANCVRVYNEKINKNVMEYFDKVGLIEESLEKEFFVFHLQPIVSSATLKIESFEALVRINHPERGLIYPDFFINIIEKTKLLEKFELLLFKKIVEYLQTVHLHLNKYLKISVNISANSVSSGKILECADIVPLNLRQFINLEITERVFLKDSGKVIDIIDRLKKLNFMVEIDDFGTGYSSLGMIEQVSFDILKIDISFVRKMLEDEKVMGIVKTIVSLGKNLGLQTIAEGVETKEQAEILKSIGCDFLQGYFFSKPIPLENAIDIFKNQPHFHLS